jgi:hypothetical protein
MECTYHEETPKGGMMRLLDRLQVNKLLETSLAIEIVLTAFFGPLLSIRRQVYE